MYTAQAQAATRAFLQLRIMVTLQLDACAPDLIKGNDRVQKRGRGVPNGEKMLMT